MGFNNFRVNIVLRVLVLLALTFVLVWGYVKTDWQMTLVVSGVLLLIMLIELVHYVETSNRHFTAFLNSITVHDFSIHYDLHKKGNSFDVLGKAFNKITLAMQQLNSERAAQHQLLEAVIEHVGIALFCIDDQGKITLMNQSAKRLFNTPYIHHAFALGKIDERLPALVRDATAGESQLINLNLDGQQQPVSMFTTKFELLGENYSLVSLQNIREELESREVESWRKLIKVLTHEIMNSVTPIVSLSSVIKEALISSNGKLSVTELSEQEAMDLVRSLLAIEARGKGLVSFVQSYNNLANVPQPYITDVAVLSLLERLRTLVQGEMTNAGITLSISCAPEELMLRADTQQVEQVLINLLKNARESISGDTNTCNGGAIHIAASINADGHVQITVKDTGAGIGPDKLQDIFIPFYTTKKGGSGIGLSISRQLMQANKGYIAVNSEEGKGTLFTLVFRQA